MIFFTNMTSTKKEDEKTNKTAKEELSEKEEEIERIQEYRVQVGT